MKKNLIIVLMLLSLILLYSCKKEIDYSLASNTPPDDVIMEGDYNLDFVEMHNEVIRTLQNDFTPFFYVVNNKFDISGSNEKKLIEIKCTCLDGTVTKDVDLFFSMVLNLVSINASEQDFRFKAPSMDSDGTYTDFGSVFDTYDLVLFANTSSGNILKEVKIKHGDEISIESRYIKE